MKLKIEGTFDVPVGVHRNEALVRLAIRLKQIAQGVPTEAQDWHGTAVMVEIEPEL